jgi:predicted dithiol-disulfide oxidoreductase (DUF899 family)
VADHFNSLIVHRNARDVSFAAVSRASSAKIEAFKKRMGWSFQWVSSQKCDFNRDYYVSSTKEEMAMGKVEYNYGPHKFPSEQRPASVCSTGHKRRHLSHLFHILARAGHFSGGL